MTEDSSNKPKSNSEDDLRLELPDDGGLAGINLVIPDSLTNLGSPAEELSLNSINNVPLNDGLPAMELAPPDGDALPAMEFAAPNNDASPAMELPALDGDALPAMEPASTDGDASPAMEPASTENDVLPAMAGFTDDFDLDSEPESSNASEESREQVSIPQESAVKDPIQQIKNFSEMLPMENVQVPAAFPFSLIIEGELLPEEKEKLLDVISREKMGFREVDLEPQLQNDRILIPRISEYAGVLLIQALRGTSARMRLGPSDSIFSTADTLAESDPLSSGFSVATSLIKTRHDDSHHPAENLAVTSADSLPQLPRFEVIDTLLASAILTSNTVEATRTAEYQEMVENLKREIKYKAHRKGAAGIIRFHVELQSLSLSSQYRLNVSGTAVRSESPENIEAEALPDPVV